ncbi:hypothetical protein PPYR_07208 [Photinus pyralis]|nr:hypothetical protein PPYR_07208 [Photinus pyralis]
MVRKYKRKSTQHSWSEEGMKNAISDCKAGNLSVAMAAKTYDVPLTTLYRKMKLNSSAEEASQKKLGRYRPTFTKEQEQQLRDYILLMEKRLFGLSMRDFRSLAYQYAELNRIPHSFCKKTALAGEDWVSNFLKRNPEISLRLPEKTSAARAAAFNRPNVANFFALLGELMDKYHFTASQIYNCDETGLSTVPNKPSKILSLKGKKQIGSLSSAERGTLVTAEICVSASGHYIPPLLIFPRVRLNPLFDVGLPPDSVVVCHPSGWMQTDIFVVWFKHFVRYAKPTNTDPVLLIMDGHATHTKNIEMMELAKSTNVHILILPPHTSHRLQPLDVSYMFPLSAFYEQEVRAWQRNHPGKVVTIHNVGALFGKAYQRASTQQNATSGFQNTGIFPYNPHIFPDDLFEPSETTNRELPPTPPAALENLIQEVNNTTPPPAATTSSIPDKPQSKSQKLLAPEEILPIPKADVQLKQRTNRNRGKTMILTSTPNMEEIKEKHSTPKIPTKAVKRKISSSPKINNCPVKRKQENKNTEKKVFVESDLSGSNETISYADSSESPDAENESELSFEEDRPLHYSTVSVADIHPNDYVLIDLQDEAKKTKKRFVAQVMCAKKNRINVKFMREYRQSKNIYVFPAIPDESEVFLNEIIGRLHSYELLRYGKIKFL